MKKDRNVYLDVLKGVTMLLVVFGHTFQKTRSDWQEDTLWIVMFHMPLFMVISGYFFYLSVEKYDIMTFIRKKFLRLYVPSLFWGAFTIVLVGGGKILKNKPIETTYILDLLFTGMWFLTVLFILSIVGCVIHKYCNRYKYMAWIIMYVVILLYGSNWLRNELICMTPFFLFGSLLGKYRHNWNISWGITLLALCVFIYCYYYFDWDDTMYAMTDDICSLVWWKSYVLRIFAGLSGSILTMYLCIWILKLSKVSVLLSYVGIFSLPIYVLHQKFFIYNQFVNCPDFSIWLTFLSFVLVLFLSIGSYLVLRKSSVLRKIMFGEYK